ncbi:MAG TPA: hypothetical protein VMB18_19510 [Terriglobales bacterium]|nr:hypothetical protein [Terriglobales bacterium]
MSFKSFRDFTELYRAAYAETDERKKAHLLREVERIIKNAQVEAPRKSLSRPRPHEGVALHADAGPQSCAGVQSRSLPRQI